MTRTKREHTKLYKNVINLQSQHWQSGWRGDVRSSQ